MLLVIGEWCSRRLRESDQQTEMWGSGKQGELGVRQYGPGLHLPGPQLGPVYLWQPGTGWPTCDPSNNLTLCSPVPKLQTNTVYAVQFQFYFQYFKTPISFKLTLLVRHCSLKLQSNMHSLCSAVAISIWFSVFLNLQLQHNNPTIIMNYNCKSCI